MKTSKRFTEKAVSKCISMPATLLDKAEDRRRQHEYGTFSDYVQMLIRHDVHRGKDSLAFSH